MNGPRKSDRLVVPGKPANKAGQPAAEAVEGRSLAGGKADQQNVRRTQSRESTPSALDRVREAAGKDRKAKFTALLHHVTVERLRAAYEAQKPKAAAGVDGVTWAQYGEGLDEKLVELHARLHRGAYRAKPTRRAYIPKADGKKRGLGIAAMEDKVVQRAVVEVMNAIYETDFLGFSYGFRPGRSQHNALDALATAVAHKKVNWVLDADIRGYFDTIDHEWLKKFIGHRVADGRIMRLIQKWLSAGVMEQGQWTESKEGTPQGATVSPLLANIYLHYVLDLWVQQWRKRQARGEVIIVRYADDFIVGFQHRDDAERFQYELARRLGRFKLELHPDKTRLIEFGRFAAQRRVEKGQPKPETFDFLGFTHMCGRRREGGFLLVRHTSQKRMRRRLREVREELHDRRHTPVHEQGRWLGDVMRGYFQYHAVHTNIRALQTFRRQVERHWLHALRRRGQRDRTDWVRVKTLSERWLPRPHVSHPWPDERFYARTSGKSPVR
jgi:RNA-directed DNA polymerase